MHTECKYMYTPTETCTRVFKDKRMPIMCAQSLPSLPIGLAITHIHSDIAHAVTPILDLPLKLQKLHFTSVSELCSAIAACILAEESWLGSLFHEWPPKDSFVSVEQQVVPSSISWYSAELSWEWQQAKRKRKY